MRVVGIADAVRQRRPVPAAVADPVAAALLRNARAMIDVDYVGSPLVADCRGTGADTAAEPHPGPTLPRLDAVWRDLPRRACFWT